jgi:hypothetical protein
MSSLRRRPASSILRGSGTAVDDLAQHLDLAGEPAIVEHQLVDVAKQHAQQLEHAGADFGLVGGGQLELVCEGAQARADLAQASGLAATGSFGAQRGGGLAQRRLFLQQRRQGLAQADGDELAQGVDGGGVDAWSGGRGGRGSGGARGRGGPCVGTGRSAGVGFVCRVGHLDGERIGIGHGLRPALEQALQAGVQRRRVGCAQHAVEGLALARRGPAGLTRLPLAQQVADELVPGLRFAQLEAVEVALECGLGGLVATVGERLVELVAVALALGAVARQAAGEFAHEGFGQGVVVGPGAGDLVIELAVVVRRGGNPAQRELAQGFAGDLGGIAGRGHVERWKFLGLAHVSGILTGLPVLSVRKFRGRARRESSPGDLPIRRY